MDKTAVLLAKAFASSVHASHPELQKDEVWVGNRVRSNEYEFYSWETERTGSFAYNADGEILRDQIPVFIKSSEYESALANLSPTTYY